MNRDNQQEWTIYLHRGCFDGLVSATLAWEFLASRRQQVKEFRSVDYDERDTWLAESLHRPAAVLDFLYHPDAGFWADHHATSFLSLSAREDFLRRKSDPCLLYNDNAGSCAGLLWRSLHSQIPGAGRLQDAISWAEKIDTANYASVDEAICGDTPALRIKQSLGELTDRDYRLLVAEMRSGDLEQVANLPLVADRFSVVKQRIADEVAYAEANCLLEGNVAVMDIGSSLDDSVERYGPYKAFPQARYSIAIMRSPKQIKIRAMRNPWLDFPSIPLGKILEAFKGGGHERIGSVVIANDENNVSDIEQKLSAIKSRLLSEMQSLTATESLAV